MIKPTKYPDWTLNPDGSDNDIIDPTTGENNVEEPSSGKKELGWEYNEKPNRQYFNWLSRLTSKWLRYLDNKVENFPDNYISGFNTVFINNSTCEFNSGICKDAYNGVIIKADLTLEKLISSSWVQGNSQGGFGGSTASPVNGTFYHTFVIYKEGEDPDFGFDDSPNCSNLLSESGFTKYRRIGSVLYDSGGIQDFVQKGDYFYHYPDPIHETLDLIDSSGQFLSGTKIVCPSNINRDIDGVLLQISNPADNDTSGIFCNIWLKSISSSFAQNGSELFYDSKNDSSSNKVSSPIIFKPFPREVGIVDGKIVIRSNRDSTVNNLIEYNCFGYKDNRGKDGVID